MDYLSIDTEGTEYEILKNLNFQKFKFSIITIDIIIHNNREKYFYCSIKNGYKK